MKQPDKTLKAVALRYNETEDLAPRVVASGKGDIAHKIIQTAKESGVPVHEDPELAEMLSRLELGSEIPVELYHMVAQILVFIYRLDKNWAASTTNTT
ncbi:MAG: EscU/YscU/HrcU family type III secretion system export apparatus switch protein [Moorellaceae bacterium]